MSIISDTIKGSTQYDNLIIQAIDKRINEPTYALKLFRKAIKESINTGEAIVNVLGNTGIAGFKFHIPEKEQVKMQSEVTDHYIDTNTPVQDHIARKPVTITLNGFQGDYFYSVNKIEDTLAKVIPTMALVKQFLPRLSDNTKQQIVNKYEQLMGTADNQITRTKPIPIALQANNTWYSTHFVDVDLFQLFQDMYKLKSAQTRAFFFLETLWLSSASFTVETTWKRYQNMVITDIIPMRDNNADITDFSVSFKQVNSTSSLVQSLENATGRTRQQLAEIANKGVDKGKKKETV